MHGDFWGGGIGVTSQEFHNGVTFCSSGPQLVCFSSQETFLSVIQRGHALSWTEDLCFFICLSFLCGFFFLSCHVVQYCYYHNSFPFFFSQGTNYVISFNIWHRLSFHQMTSFSSKTFFLQIVGGMPMKVMVAEPKPPKGAQRKSTLVWLWSLSLCTQATLWFQILLLTCLLFTRI